MLLNLCRIKILKRFLNEMVLTSVNNLRSICLSFLEARIDFFMSIIRWLQNTLRYKFPCSSFPHRRLYFTFPLRSLPRSLSLSKITIDYPSRSLRNVRKDFILLARTLRRCLLRGRNILIIRLMRAVLL